MSKIKIYVEWKQPVMFAGENVECTITVKNEAEELGQAVLVAPHLQGRRFVHNNQARTLPEKEDKKRLSIPPRSPLTRFSVEGLKVESQQYQDELATAKTEANELPEVNHSNECSSNRKNHTRSVSIVSLGSTPSYLNEQDGICPLPSPILPQTRRYRRAASSQGLESDSLANSRVALSPRIPSGTLSTIGTPARMLGPAKFQFKNSGRHHFQKLNSTHFEDNPQNIPKSGPARPGKGPIQSIQPAFPRPNSLANQDSHISRVMTSVSPNDTPRTSTDLNSPSNNSTETLISEYTGPSINRTLTRHPHERQSSYLGQVMSGWRSSEILMMGYASLMGSFVLDESLVNAGPFEEVKRKGTIGLQGSGGVVGIEPKKRDNGLLGNLGWNNLGESLGGLLKPAEPSSLRVIKGIAKSKAVPILSTPQAILFIDLHLKPGEARSFTYSHSLPETIPPSHKGRAIRVAYSLMVGIQRQQLNLQQHPVRHVEVPFRILPSVNGKSDSAESLQQLSRCIVDGIVTKYDLMSPYIQIKDTATVKDLGKLSRTGFTNVAKANIRGPTNDPSEFISYVNGLLSGPAENPSIGLLSPTEPTIGGSHKVRESRSTEENVHILTTQGHAWTKFGPSRYQIQRNGERVAIILLSRPVFRLGESIPIVVDFRTATTPCHSLQVYLESLESINPSIALRSEPNTHRTTRKVYASQSEYASYGSRLFFNITVPVTGTPDFVTSGVGLIWRLRFEFVTVIRPIGITAEKGFMEELIKSERGRTMVAEEDMVCESFEANVPLRVFGMSSRLAESTTPVGISI